MPSNSICCCSARNLPCSFRPEFAALRQKITALASLLEGLQNIPMVAAELGAHPRTANGRVLADVTARCWRRCAAPAEPHQADRAQAAPDRSIRISRTRSGRAPPSRSRRARRHRHGPLPRQGAAVPPRQHNHIAILKLHRNEPLTATTSRARAHLRRSRGRHAGRDRTHSRGRGPRPLRPVTRRPRPRRGEASLRSFIQGRKLRRISSNSST